MGKYRGTISSLGDYTVITTTVVHEDLAGGQRVGMFDRQKERFIDGLTIGSKTFGRMSCPSNLYPHFEKGKEACIYTWWHPFLGFPPFRTGVVGIAYPGEGKVYAISATQLVMSLVALALLPILWAIPGLLVGGLLSSILSLGKTTSSLIVVLIALSPWFAGLGMIWSYWQIKSEPVR